MLESEKGYRPNEVKWDDRSTFGVECFENKPPKQLLATYAANALPRNATRGYDFPHLEKAKGL